MAAPQPPAATAAQQLTAAAATLSSHGRSFVLFAGGEGAEGPLEKGWTCAGSFCMSSSVDVFDGSTGELVQTLQLSEPRSRLAAAAHGCLVVFAGGKTLSGFSAAVDVVSICDGNATISKGSPLSVARGDLAGAAVQQSGGLFAVFAGGAGADGVSGAVDTVLLNRTARYL